MNLREFQEKLNYDDDKSSLVMVMNAETGLLFTIIDVEEEIHEDTNQTTIWVKVQEF